MARLHAIVKHPRRLLGALAALLAAVGVVVGSGASFTASSANPSNVFTAGALTIDNSNEGAAILTASNMKPGDPATTGTVDIENSGSLTGAFTLARGTLNDSDATFPMSEKLNLTITDCGTFVGATPPTCGDGDDTSIYSGGTLAEMGTSGHEVAPLGNLAAGVKHRYRFSVSFDASADNDYADDSSTVQFLWSAS